MWKCSRELCTRLGVLLLAAGAVAAELGELGEEGEQVDLAGDHVAAGLAGLLPGAEVVRKGLRLAVRVGVVPQHDRAERDRPLGDADLRRRLGSGLGKLEVGTGLRGRGHLGLVLLGFRLDPQQRRTGLHLAAGLDGELAHPSGERRLQHRLHLHALEDEHARPAATVSPTATGVAATVPAPAAEHAALVAGDPVR